MADQTPIEWTDATLNVTTGCDKTSPGCKNCFALREWPRLAANPATVYYRRAFGDVQCHPERLAQPFHWKRGRKVFLVSMSDLFHPSVPFAFLAAVFAMMAATPQHTYQLLTKRPARMLAFLRWLTDPASHSDDPPATLFSLFMARRAASLAAPRTDPLTALKQIGVPLVHAQLRPDHPGHVALDDIPKQATWPLKNVWLGTSVEDQPRSDDRLPPMRSLAADGWTTWVSYEPALGPVDWRPWLKFLRWIVPGGESGPRARPPHPDWFRDVRDLSRNAGVPLLFKQWGTWREAGADALLDGEAERGARQTSRKERLVAWDGRAFRHLADVPPGVACRPMARAGKKASGRELDGVVHHAFPEDVGIAAASLPRGISIVESPASFEHHE